MKYREVNYQSVAGTLLASLIAVAGAASAQNIDKFTVTGEMAKKAMVRGEINVATAENSTRSAWISPSRRSSRSRT
jgi:hypothetical protein